MIQEIALIIGLAAVASVIIYFSFKLQQEHFVLQLLGIFVAFILLALVPAAAAQAQEVCELVETMTMEELVYANNLTSYHWEYDYSDAPTFSNPNDPSAVFLFHVNTTHTYEEQCYEKDSELPGSFMFTYYGFLSLFFTYVSVMIVWTVFKRLSARFGRG